MIRYRIHLPNGRKIDVMSADVEELRKQYPHAIRIKRVRGE